MRWVLILLGALVACGCGGKVCTPGASSTCTDSSLGCVGTHVCNAEGTGFGACDCGAAWEAPCNLVTQEGCPSGKRCGWISDSASHGAPGCVPIGDVAALQTCGRGVPGVSTGYDDCQAGLVCVNSECRAACRAGTCGPGFACQGYSGLDDGSGNLGVCEPTCDPVTQTRSFDEAAACGSPNPATPTRGCYGVPGTASQPTQFTCAPAVNATKTHRVAAADATGTVFLNSCAPGYAPLLVRSSTDLTPVCIAFCAPHESYSGSTELIQGVPPHTCPARGATAPTEECRYLWFLEDRAAPLSPYSNTVGFCLDPTFYPPAPSCATLPNTDTDTPPNGFPENLEAGCAPRG